MFDKGNAFKKRKIFSTDNDGDGCNRAFAENMINVYQVSYIDIIIG